jgi:spore germination cell wall hydrolase CwlJ-like protein
MVNQFNEWLISINESTTLKEATLVDIWRGYETLNYGDYQLNINSPLMQVQARLIEMLNTSNPKWVKSNGFKTDNDFGSKTSRALGLVVTGKEFINHSEVSIGPNTLTKLGFKKPATYSNNINILATTLSVESGPNSKNKEVNAIANVIINRKKAKNRYAKKRGESKRFSVIDITIDPSQFSLWNVYQSGDMLKMTDSVMKRRRPENNTNWNYCVVIAKKMLSVSNIPDVTLGATHYYNSSEVIPPWGEGNSQWVEHKIGLIHTFGRDTATNWAKVPVI